MNKIDPSKIKGKPFIKSKKLYYLIISSTLLILLITIILSLLCEFCWQCPGYFEIILILLMILLSAGAGGVYTTSYDKYKDSFSEKG